MNVSDRVNRKISQKQGVVLGLALAGIDLVTLNSRTGITSLSPIYDVIGQDIPINPLTQGILGMLSPLAFALFGWLAPRFIPLIGLEKSLLLCMILIFTGILTRSFSNNIWLFGILFIVALAGMGMSNVFLPPTIKHFFPNRIGLVTSIYTAMVPISASIPSLFAVPLSQSQGWRFSTGIWAGLALLAALPWILLLKNNQKPIWISQERSIPVWRWPTAWAIMVIFGIGSLNTSTMISWLPKILTSTGNINQATAGLMVSVLSAAGFLPCLFVPTLLIRSRHPIYTIVLFSACFVLGYLGLAYLPTLTWVWVIFIGFGMTLIPISLTLINLRSHTTGGAARLSGFVQGGGYLLGATGPFLIGWFNHLTGEWTLAIWFLIVMAFIAIGVGIFVDRARFIEEAKFLYSKIVIL